MTTPIETHAGHIFLHAIDQAVEWRDYHIARAQDVALNKGGSKEYRADGVRARDDAEGACLKALGELVQAFHGMRHTKEDPVVDLEAEADKVIKHTEGLL